MPSHREFKDCTNLPNLCYGIPEIIFGQCTNFPGKTLVNLEFRIFGAYHGSGPIIEIESNINKIVSARGSSLSEALLFA